MKKNTEHSGSSPIKSAKEITSRHCPLSDNECKLADELNSNDQALLEALFNSVHGLLYIYTEEKRLIRWNKRHEEMTGYTSEELMNFRIEDWFDEDEHIKLAREWAKVFSEGYTETELNLIRKDGRKVPYLFTGSLAIVGGKPHLVGVGIDITERKKAEEENIRALDEIKRLKELLEAENIYLKKEMKSLFEGHGVIGQSDEIKYVLFMVQQVAQTEATVLIMGETGTGKGRIANLIHQSSQRKDKPFVVVNCAALPGNLIESELFGREKGAFTGAESKQIGRFELANGGTIFLDEIGELPIELQPKLLKVIEEGKFERLGSPHTVKVDVRIIASTNRNLKEEISKGRFRKDLFYRLNIFPITIPPLRQHKEDIPLLVRYFMEISNKRLKKNITKISEEMLRSLMAKPWPGNVRELMGVVERAMITSDGPELHVAEPIEYDFQLTKIDSDNEFSKNKIQSKKSLADVEKDHVISILENTNWKIEGANGAAKLLGLNPSTLRARIKKLGIRRPDTSR